MRKLYKQVGKITRNRVREMFHNSLAPHNLFGVVHKSTIMKQWDDDERSFFRVVWESDDGLLSRLPFATGPEWLVHVSHEITPAQSDKLANNVATFIKEGL